MIIVLGNKIRTKMSICMIFYFPVKLQRRGFVVNVKWPESLVLACCITFIIGNTY